MTRMASVGGKNTKRKHLNKNKKKSWRKVDITDVEEALEDERLQERTGGKVSEKKNASLFFVDKKKSDLRKVLDTKVQRKRKAQEKLAEIEEGLKPPPPEKKKKLPPAARERLADHKLSSVRITALQQRQEARKNVHRLREASRRQPVAKYDLWGDTLDKDLATEDAHYMKVTKKRRVEVPNHHKTPVSLLPAVEVSHPGSSYNPAYEEHQELLHKASAVEVKKERIEEKIKRALTGKFPTVDEAPTERTRLNEMSAGLFEEEEDDSSDDETHDPDKLSVNPPVCRQDKKDEKQRRKDKERKAMAVKTKTEKTKRLRDNEFFRLKGIKKEIKKQEEKVEKQAEKRAEYQAGHLYRTRRLGKLKFEEPEMELKLSDELAGSLRELKPEGHLMADRFNSFQKRNMIEPRLIAKSQKKYKPKLYPKKGHKEIKA